MYGKEEYCGKYLESFTGIERNGGAKKYNYWDGCDTYVIRVPETDTLGRYLRQERRAINAKTMTIWSGLLEYMKMWISLRQAPCRHTE